MDFDLTADQRRRYDDVLVGARERLGSAAPDPCFTRLEGKTAAGLGLTGLCLPVEYGGGGLGAVDTALCLGAFGRGGPGTGPVVGGAAPPVACAGPMRA